MIKVENLSAGYGDQPVFEALSFAIAPGESVALLGPNGCGKTTLLRTLLGLHPMRAGEVRFDHHPLATLSVKERARMCAYVPQSYASAFGYPVREVVLMGAMAGLSDWARPGPSQRDQAEAALQKMQLQALADRPVTELSGGQRQMVLIARALAQNTPLILMDEPTNGLDYGNQIRLIEKMNQLRQEGQTLVFTTHHPAEALAGATRALTLSQGRLLKSGPPHSILTPDHLAALYEIEPDQLKRFDQMRMHASSSLK